VKFALLTIVLVASTAGAQPTPQAPAPQAPTPQQAPPPAPTDEEAQRTVTQVDAASCARLGDLTPGALISVSKATPGALATPIPWSEFEIQGSLIDDKATVRALLEPTMQQLRTSLSLSTLPQLAQVTARFGYQLVGHFTQDLPSGTKLVLLLSPLPLVKRVQVTVNEKLTEKLLEDEVRRRMGVRAGSYLPLDPLRRQCAIFEERHRIEEFLYDEGYFNAEVKIAVGLETTQATITVRVDLKNRYRLGTVTVACPVGYDRTKTGACIEQTTQVLYPLELSEQQIQDIFKHKCNVQILSLCITGKPGYSRSQYQKDIQTLKQRFHDLGYPGVRVVSTDPRASIGADRTVNPVLTIDQRRRVQPEFIGFDPDVIPEEELRKQLTFNDAGSADDVEAAASAKELTTYLQKRGFFDAKVTWTRERKDVEAQAGNNLPGLHEDIIRFYIDAGVSRHVVSVQFVGNRVIDSKKLEDLVATKAFGLGKSILGTSLAATSAELINDQERIKEAYRREGYPDAAVWPSASTDLHGLGDAALAASLQALDRRDELFVRFTIDEGLPTLISRVVVQPEGQGALDRELCEQVLRELSSELSNAQIAKRSDNDKCAATIGNLKYRADDVGATRDRLRDYLFKKGRARAGVEYVINPIGPHRVEARYTIRSPARLKIGKIIIRGNFKTDEQIIRNELALEEGQLLTSDALADAARRLRTTGLFDAVNIDMPDLDCGRDRQCNSEVINAVVRVEERYLAKAEVTAEVGYSYQNGPFLRGVWEQRNIFGLGLLFRLQATYGSKIKDAEGTFRIPQWIPQRVVSSVDWLRINTDLTGLYREQDTPRFGLLTTEGVTIAFTRVWLRPRSETESALSKSLSLHYDFRLRTRNVDAVRPIGSDMDASQVAVQTRTGSIGITGTWDHRIDRRGQLSPLAPEDGSYLEAQVSLADPSLGGQDSFLKFMAAVSKFLPIGSVGVLRLDARYDQGYPIGNAVLLPEVERFFAGGDGTVRGYADDRLLTELIQVGVPPLDNVSQIRVIPAGGNIRALGSIDGQVRVWKLLTGLDVAGAMFMDAGLITNKWSTVRDRSTFWNDAIPTDVPDLRASVGMGVRFLTPFGIGAVEYAVPLSPKLGDDPRGRIHFYFAARAQF